MAVAFSATGCHPPWDTCWSTGAGEVRNWGRHRLPGATYTEGRSAGRFTVRSETLRKYFPFQTPNEEGG